MAETNGYMRFFPYEEPYDNQREAMDRIYNAFSRGQDVLFEGACGTGKTLSSLVPALEYAREEDKTVVITTNVHQQMRQFVADARAITEEESIRAVVFRGKGSMCHIDVGFEECQVLRDNTYEVVDAESDLAELEDRQEELLEASQEGDERAAEARSAVMDELEQVQERVEGLEEQNTCEYYYNNLVGDNDEFYSWLYDDVRTPDDIYEFAEQQQLCGYELLKDGMEGVDLVVCNYHHLLDPMIREQFFRWLDRDPEDVITIFDEAHNVEDTAREHATRTLTENTLDSALDELQDSDDARSEPAYNVISAFRAALEATYEDNFGFGDREKVGDDWEDVSIANESKRDDLTLAFLQQYTGKGIDTELELAVHLGRELDEEYEEAYKTGEATTRQECQTLQAATFIQSFMDESAELGQYPVVSVRRDEATEEVYGRAELYTCIPREVTEELFGEVYATVLMSATLRPFDVSSAVLGLDDPVEIAYGLQFPEENRRTFAVETPALFSSERDDPDTQEAIAGVLRDSVEFTAGNTLLFFPSYAEAERYYDRLSREFGGGSGNESAGTTLLMDEPGTSVEDLRQRFVASDDAALFTSLWGTLAEGVSFDGDEARTVVVVGVPYPHLNDRMEAVQEAYDRTFADRSGRDSGWEYAVEIPTIRKTRQALGRVIRSPDDFGVRVLVDKRYTEAGQHDMGKYSVRGTFPPEERAEMLDLQPEKLKFAMLNFYSDEDAWDGAPPTP
ncbi:ATP-dependent DNA helicase [Halorussus gelatinilyticus]|uniref:ATP-dependent DNA helicase n=1 Tax=Halorussus gelatinilyticus TaxID=2937524 RepID=A0A8U0INA6_9EURY|nr:ATP-dependent DNA helicase [Halorussus gelatinilyticus]UPW01664.1 ATP-dependent DNA helicase [Halorussus gelatinilyticus]